MHAGDLPSRVRDVRRLVHVRVRVRVGYLGWQGVAVCGFVAENTGSGEKK